MSEAMEEYVCSKKKLYDWATLNLKERVKKLKDDHEVKICGATLANYYKKNRIRYLIPKFTYNAARQDRDEVRL